MSRPTQPDFPKLSKTTTSVTSMQNRLSENLAAAALAAVEEEHRRLVGDFFNTASTGPRVGGSREVPKSADGAMLCGTAAELGSELCDMALMAGPVMMSRDQGSNEYAIGPEFRIPDFSRVADVASAERGSLSATLAPASAVSSSRLPTLHPLNSVVMGGRSEPMHSTNNVAAMLLSNCPENAASAAAGMLTAAVAATSASASSLDSLSRFMTASSLPVSSHSPSQRLPGSATAIHDGSTQAARPRLLGQNRVPSSPSCTFQMVRSPVQVGANGGAGLGAQPNDQSGAGASVAGAEPSERASAATDALDPQRPATTNAAVEGRGQRAVVPGATGVNAMENSAAQGLHVTPIGRAVRAVGEWATEAGGGDVLTQGMTGCRMLVPGAGQTLANAGLTSCSTSWGLRKGHASGVVEPRMANHVGKDALLQQLWMQQLGLQEQKEAGGMSARDGGVDKGAQMEAWSAAMGAGGREQGEAARVQGEAGRAWHSDKELMAQQMMALQGLLAVGDFSTLARPRGDGLQQQIGQQQQQQQQGQQRPQLMRQLEPTLHQKAQGDGMQESRAMQSNRNAQSPGDAWQFGVLEGSVAQGREEEGREGGGLVATIVRQSSMQVGAEAHAAQAQRALEEAAKQKGDACLEGSVSLGTRDFGLGDSGKEKVDKAGGGGMAEVRGGKWRHEMGMMGSSLIGRGVIMGGKEMKSTGSLGLRGGILGRGRVGGEEGASSGSDGDDVDDAWGHAGMEDGAFMDGTSGGHAMVAARCSSAAAEETEVAGANSDDLALEWSRRMRRMKSNRESAKRARIKRQRRLQELEVLTSSLQRENADLSQQVVELSQQMQQSEAQKEELEKEVEALRACALAMGTGGAATPTAPVTHSTRSPHTAPNPFTLPPRMGVTTHASQCEPPGGDRTRQPHETTSVTVAAQDAVVGDEEGKEVAAVDAALLPVCIDEDSVTGFV
ncbi:unnamed protein product [Closterium sp. Yama58-4]|nr:unnamed protein product [Closterium sp. Yama58-4]